MTVETKKTILLIKESLYMKKCTHTDKLTTTLNIDNKKIAKYTIKLNKKDIKNKHIKECLPEEYKITLKFDINDIKIDEINTIEQDYFISTIQINNKNENNINILCESDKHIKKIELNKVRNCIIFHLEKGAAILGYISKDIEMTKKENSIDTTTNNNEIKLIFTFSKKNVLSALDKYDTINRNIALNTKEYQQIDNETEDLTTNKEINEAFKWSSIHLKNIDPNNIPETRKMTSEEKLYYTLGANSIGETKKAELIFEEISKNIETLTEKTYPLFIFTLENHINHINDRITREHLEKRFKNTIDYCITQYKIYKHKQKNDIELDALWLLALDTTDKKEARNILHTIESKCNTDDITIKHILPLFSGKITKLNANNIIKIIKQEFMTSYGIRTRSCLNPKYKPSIEQEGAISLIKTALFTIGVLQYDIDEGHAMLKNLSKLMGTHTIGHFQKTLNAADGSQIKTSQNDISLETTALIIYAIDTYLAGIKPKLSSNRIFIRPKISRNLNDIMRNDKQIGTNKMHTYIKWNDTEDKDLISMNIIFENRPNNKGIIELPGEFKTFIINGKETVGPKCEFRMKQINNILALKNKSINISR
ncbi:MAG: hypothetical protein K0B02_02480 [DPANN group archaeon]|nr:hypothetical protein [DPANN group archaeon]